MSSPASPQPSNRTPKPVFDGFHDPLADRDTLPWTGVSVLLAIVGLLLFLAVPMKVQTEAQKEAERLEFSTRAAHAELQAAIEDYRLDHDGRSPGLIPTHRDSLSEPEHSGEWFVRQLTMYSSSEGRVVPQKLVSHPFGPYLPGDIPLDPSSGSRAVRVLARGEAMPTRSTGEGGWIYDPVLDELRLDRPDWIEGVAAGSRW